MTDHLNTRERRALEHLRKHETLIALSGVGKSTLRDLLRKGCIEPLDSTFDMGDRYRLTPEGKALLDSPENAKPRAKPRLKTLEPRLKTLPPRLK